LANGRRSTKSAAADTTSPREYFRVHFGMGHATKADLTIRWPDGAVGKVETIAGVDANQGIVVREGRGIVERHPFTHDTK
jgi:hypothetical protein